MEGSLTYRNCKKVYLDKKARELLTTEYVVHQLDVIDVFLLASRINQDEYAELSSILNG